MSRPLSVNHSSCVTGCHAKPTLLRMPSAYVSSPVPSGFMRRIAAVIAAGAQMLHVEPTDMYSMSSGPNAMNFHVCPWFGFGRLSWTVTGVGRRVEVLFDVVEPENLARGRHIQRAVAHRDAVGLT